MTRSITLVFLLAICLGLTPGSFGSTPNANLTKPAPGWDQSTPGFHLRLSDDARCRSFNKDCFELFSGEMLLVANETGLVKTPLGITYVKEDSIVLFKINTGIERIMALHVPGQYSVVTIANNRAARLGAGHEVVITDHRPRVRETRQADQIARRQFQSFDVGKGLFMTTTEFSIWHVLATNPLLNAEDPISRTACQRMQKTASILDIVMVKHGPYTINPPDDLLDYEPL